jgi:hypothetical protein
MQQSHARLRGTTAVLKQVCPAAIGEYSATLLCAFGELSVLPRRIIAASKARIEER